MEARFSPKYIDIHCHISGDGMEPSGALPPEGVIEVFSMTTGEYQDACVTCEVHGAEDVDLERRSTVGVYPFDADKVDLERSITHLDEIVHMRRSGLFGIGEIGLDYREPYRSFKDRQIDLFEREINVARKVQCPIVIHQVRALDDTLRCLEGVGLPVIFHGFSGSYESAVRILNRGYYLSFGSLIFDNQKLRDILRRVPLEQVFFERDQYAGSISEIYREAAVIRNISEEELRLIIYKNFRNVDSLARENNTFIG